MKSVLERLLFDVSKIQDIPKVITFRGQARHLIISFKILHFCKRKKYAFSFVIAFRNISVIWLEESLGNNENLSWGNLLHYEKDSYLNVEQLNRTSLFLRLMYNVFIPSGDKITLVQYCFCSNVNEVINSSYWNWGVTRHFYCWMHHRQCWTGDWVGVVIEGNVDRLTVRERSSHASDPKRVTPALPSKIDRAANSTSTSFHMQPRNTFSIDFRENWETWIFCNLTAFLKWLIFAAWFA